LPGSRVITPEEQAEANVVYSLAGHVTSQIDGFPVHIAGAAIGVALAYHIAQYAKSEQDAEDLLTDTTGNLRKAYQQFREQLGRY
jgi:hypothetical protein